MAQNTLVIACEVLRYQIEALGPLDYKIEYMKQGLHRSPELLHKDIQETIDKNCQYSRILLAYGQCSNAIVGLKACPEQILVVPRVDDCIGISMGSRDKYYEEFNNNPGTYYFTKGWIEADSDPLKDYYASIPKYGEELALWAAKESIRHYTRACLIKTIGEDLTETKQYVKKFADFFQIKFEEVEGSLNYLRQLLQGPWDHNFVVVKGGEEISFNSFY